MVEVSSDDVKQFVWCKRKVYFRRVLNAGFVPTFKMKFGREVEENAKIPILEGEKLYRKFYMFDEEFGVVAVADALIVSDDHIKVVEVKSRRYSKRIDEHHKFQLALQVLLVKKFFPNSKVSCCVFYVDEGVFEEIRLDERHFKKVLELVKEIREIVGNEVVPEPTYHRAKCVDCEYLTFCRDVDS